MGKLKFFYVMKKIHKTYTKPAHGVKTDENKGNRKFSSSSLSVFIMWFCHFDVNLFRHRHSGLFSVNRTHFLYQQMDFTYMQVVDLRRFLQEGSVLLFSLGISFRKTV